MKSKERYHLWKLFGGFLLPILLFSACGKADTLPSKILNATDSYTVETQQIGNVAGFDNFQILQGGCVTEDYAWFILLDNTTTVTYSSSECRVVKYDMETMEEIARSEVMKLGHANDIAYIADANKIYVIHVDGKKVSVLDAESLELKE